MNTNIIKMVIGSWGSYNECNERALGSNWLCLNNYDDWDEIAEELEKQGFELDGTDEELFVQDIENFICSNSVNWDYVHPKDLFELLKKSGVLDDENKYEKAVIYCDIEGYDYWKQKVEDYEDNWDEDIYLYPNMDWYDLGYYFLHEVDGIEIPDCLENYIDYRRYGEEFSYEGFHEYDGGIVEIRR